MKKIFYLLIISISIACTSTKEYNKAIVEKHAVVDLKSDVDLTYQILKDGHPGLYWYISKKNLDFKFDSLKNSINEPLTTAEFYQKIAPVVAAIRCGHTSIKAPLPIYTKQETEAAKKITLPLNQFTYSISPNKGLYILNNKSENKALKPGTEIIAIDGKPVQSIIDQIEQAISTDGYNLTHQHISLERSFAQRYKIYYPTVDSLHLKYRISNDSIAETIVNTINKKKVVDTAKILKPIIAKIKPIKKPKHRGNYEEGKPQLDFSIMGKNKDFAYLKILSFSIPNANYEMFYKECFDSIKRVGAKNLIIDLRNNGGGSLDASRNLFAYLTDKEFVYLGKPIANGYFDERKYGSGFQKVNYFLFGHNDKEYIDVDKEGNFYTFMRGYKKLPPNKNNFKGKVYVLINGYSFSASTLLSANLKGINRATFVGEESGGGFNQCVAGKLPVIELKNSKLLLRFGLFQMTPNAKTDIYGRGIFPDIAISSTVEDKIKGIDRELDWVLNNNKTEK